MSMLDEFVRSLFGNTLRDNLRAAGAKDPDALIELARKHPTQPLGAAIVALLQLGVTEDRVPVLAETVSRILDQTGTRSEAAAGEAAHFIAYAELMFGPLHEAQRYHMTRLAVLGARIGWTS